MSKFDVFFKKKVNDELSVKSYSKGDLFPFFLQYKEEFLSNYLFCFISFNCSDCMKILKYLDKFSEGFNGKFILCTDGNSDENKEIKTYFNYRFDIVTYENEELIKLVIPRTPYIYVLDSDFKILQSVVVNTEEELNKEINGLNLQKIGVEDER